MLLLPWSNPSARGSMHSMDSQSSPGRRTTLLSVREVADALAVSPSTVWRLADRGYLRRLRIGHSVRFRLEDVEALIQRCEQFEEEMRDPAVGPDRAEAARTCRDV